jgi:hypothetical protein
MIPTYLRLPGLLVLWAVLGAANNLYGQNEAVSKMAQVMTDSLAYLQLTDKQKQEALALNTTAAGSLVQLKQKAKADTTLKGPALYKQVIGIMQTRNKGLSAILVPDQQKLLAQHEAEQMADLQTKMMTTQLDLTAQQVPQVYQINLKSTTEMMEDMAKLQGSKGKLAKYRDAKAMKSDSKDKDEAMKKILSASQYDIYQKNKEAMQAAMKQKMQEKKS